MKLDYAFISDYATERGGSVSALGIGIDTLVSPQVPTTHPHIFLVVQLRCEKNERNLHNIAVEAIDESGVAFLSQEGGVDFRAVPLSQDGVARLVFGFYLITFPTTGRFRFVLREGDSVLCEVPLMVVVPQSEQDSPPVAASAPRGKASRKKKAEVGV
jgi:hypothetical protein